MSFAKRMQGVATKMLTKFDESPSDDRRIKLVRKGVPAWDDDAGEVLPGVDDVIDLVGVTVPFSAGLVNGTTIQAGDVQAIVTSATAPTTDDKLQIDGVEWSIVDRPLVDYTGVSICYKIHARR